MAQEIYELGIRYEEVDDAWRGVFCFIPGLPVACSSKADIGSRGAGFRRTTGVRKSRVKLYRASRRSTADLGGCRTRCVLADRRIGARPRQSGYRVVDVLAQREMEKQRSPLV